MRVNAELWTKPYHVISDINVNVDEEKQVDFQSFSQKAFSFCLFLFIPLNMNKKSYNVK